ncbi:MAG: ABC transporter ATP-binding protein [Devosia sp.]
MDSVLTLEGVTKRYGALVANDQVSFAVAPGEIVALLGENGAGKSTVVNMLSGLFAPDEGTITVAGAPAGFAAPRDALAAGIGVVHQHYTLIPVLTVFDNIALSLGELGAGPFDRKALTRRIDDVCQTLGFSIDLGARVDRLDVAHQQRVEIVKALMRKVKLLVLDEPSAVLGPADRDRLFAVLRRLSGEGVGIILITHKLSDVFSVCHRAVVLRAGKVVEDGATDTLSSSDLIAAMIGTRDSALSEEIEAHGALPHTPTPTDRAVVGEATGLTLCRADGSEAVRDLSFAVRAGEILAVAGVDGNGQSELIAALAGLSRPRRGTIALLSLSSEDRGWSPAALRARGLAHIPDDRRRTAIAESMDLTANHLLCHDDSYSRNGIIAWDAARERVDGLIDTFKVKARGPREAMRALSGGNQQKLVVARELEGAPKVLVAAHPTRGLDVRTTHAIHEALAEARDRGAAIVMVSGDLDEIRLVADTVMVLGGGRAFGPVPAEEAGPERLGAWMAGQEAA